MPRLAVPMHVSSHAGQRDDCERACAEKDRAAKQSVRVASAWCSQRCANRLLKQASYWEMRGRWEGEPCSWTVARRRERGIGGKNTEKRENTHVFLRILSARGKSVPKRDSIVCVAFSERIPNCSRSRIKFVSKQHTPRDDRNTDCCTPHPSLQHALDSR